MFCRQKANAAETDGSMIGKELDVKSVLTFYLSQEITGVSLWSKEMSAVKTHSAMVKFKSMCITF